MADTVVDATAANTIDVTTSLWGPYWIDVNKGLATFIDSDFDMCFTRTTDAGVNWSKTEIVAGNVRCAACWFDRENVGDTTGNIVHVTWADTTDGAVYYVTLDISDGSQGTIRTVDSLTVSTGSNSNRLGITKTVSGNIIIAISTQTEIQCYKSDDNFATAGTDIADVFETTTEEDYVLLFPATTGDDNDAACIFWDRSANAISIKMYDDSEDDWTETAISSSMVDDTLHINMDAAVRHSDGHILLAAHTDDDSAGDDLKTWDLTPDDIDAPTVSAKTNVFSNNSESAQVGMVINQQNDDVYVSYCKGGTWQTSTDIVYHLSDDDLATWEAEEAYSETTDDNRRVMGGRSITSAGGRIQFIWYNDDTFTLYVNLVNDIEISSAVALTGSQINIGDAWKEIAGLQINIGDAWKVVAGLQINIGDAWKLITI